MTHSLPGRRRPHRNLVVLLAGGYLHNTIRADKTTCQTSAGPLDESDDDLCGPSLSHRDCRHLAQH